MRGLRHALAVALTLSVVAGLMYSQLCDTSCAFYGCAPVRQAEAMEQPEPSGHCHQTESGPAPAGHENLPACQTHADVVALLPQLTAVAALHAHEQMPVVDLSPLFSHHFAVTTVRVAAGLPFRSPPKFNTVAVLRI